jgi:DNA-binding NtrC family response regulator
MAIGVLIVSGSSADREWLADLVSSFGYWPICPSLSEAIDDAPPADAALLDLDFCGEDGWVDRLAECKARHDRMQILALGTRSLSEAERLARELRVHTLLPKPLDTDFLAVILDNIAMSTREREAREAYSRARGEAHAFDRMIGSDPAFLEVVGMARQVAASDATSVLILGESGTGKELIAHAIHAESERRDGPFVEVNCAAIPSELLESELFGHEKGAFTDAQRRKMGLFQMADKGTIFLDEIGEMSAHLQAKLLKFLDTKQLRRVSGRQTIEVDARIITATNRDLALLAGQGLFRQDLYYRLNVVQLHLPSLRRRKEDIEPLARHFLEYFASKLSKGRLTLDPGAIQAMESYPWPGNVRELMNVIERAVLLNHTSVIGPKDLPIMEASESAGSRLGLLAEPEAQPDLALPPEGISLSVVERKLIEAALNAAEGNVAEAARLLHIGRGKLRTKMRQHGVKVENGSNSGRKPSRWLVEATRSK